VGAIGPPRSHTRLLMVLQAFFDESYKPNGVFVLGGHIARPDVWANFAKQWEEMLPFGVLDKDAKFYFKMSEMVLNPERMERIGAFFRLIENSEIVSLSCKFNIVDLASAVNRLWVLNRKIDWGPFSDPYFFAFRALIDSVHDHRATLPLLTQDEKIDFIFDNHSKKSMIIAAWEGFLALRDPAIRHLFGATPRFEDDREVLPLQAADLWAGAVRQWYEDGCPMLENENGIIMVSRALVTTKKVVKHHFISYSEEKIVDSLKTILQSTFPGTIIYDDQYKSA
jgi:hypothetical protein